MLGLQAGLEVATRNSRQAHEKRQKLYFGVRTLDIHRAHFKLGFLKKEQYPVPLSRAKLPIGYSKREQMNAKNC